MKDSSDSSYEGIINWTRFLLTRTSSDSIGIRSPNTYSAITKVTFFFKRKMAKMHLNLVGFLLLYLENFVFAGGNERSFNGAIRMREGCFFTDNPLLSKRTSNVFSCTHLCLANTFCISIVFCEHGSRKTGQCHLFNRGIRPEQTVGKSPSLVEKNRCTFYQFVDVFVSTLLLSNIVIF